MFWQGGIWYCIYFTAIFVWFHNFVLHSTTWKYWPQYLYRQLWPSSSSEKIHLIVIQLCVIDNISRSSSVREVRIKGQKSNALCGLPNHRYNISVCPTSPLVFLYFCIFQTTSTSIPSCTSNDIRSSLLTIDNISIVMISPNNTSLHSLKAWQCQRKHRDHARQNRWKSWKQQSKG